MRWTKAPHCSRGTSKCRPKVQQRALAYLFAFPDRLHQPVGVVRLPRLPALDRGTADIHVATVASPAENSNGSIADYGTTFDISELTS